MTEIDPSLPISKRERVRLIVGVMLRIVVSVTLLFTAYFLIPTMGADDDSDLPWLLLELAAFGVVVAFQVPAIIKAKYPVLRAIEALALTVTLFLLIFSRIYLSNSLTNPDSFTQLLDTTTAFYFTVTVFATVGFGDIVAATNSMKLLVTLQMLLNLAVLGLVIRLITSAAKQGVARKQHRRHGSDGTDNAA